MRSHTFFGLLLLIVSGGWLIFRISVGEFFNLNKPNPKTKWWMTATYLVIWVVAITGYLVTK